MLDRRDVLADDRGQLGELRRALGQEFMERGSSSRIVTGSPFMMWKSSTKSARCIGRSLARAVRRPAVSSAMIISRTAVIRPASKNMCSVRARPMPSAPNFARGTRIERRLGIGAHLHSCGSRAAQPISVAKSPLSSG